MKSNWFHKLWRQQREEELDAEIRNHPVEQIGTVLRAYMTAMKPVI